ncbi:2-dehydro-3-deoxygalactonokinase [Flavobacterium algicola]|uniref:2-dehydro-3-deoxygalactonokinase n=1 Tax=Flavobacterium algicola TaxID=556529 RepID=UPI001EFCE577|nr:2-dehydro-3-deoxygalactonokinase [Flavobacterium algicola]MCG9793717.1 2-dehydro-3-deoxygalactonokinase [Flavobacterium algicola]
MKLPKYFISCDWGTSNFRLRLVETENLNVLEEHKTDQGVKTIFEKFQKQDSLSQQQFFTDYLVSQIQNLPAEHQKHLVVLAGMSSSSIGLYELPYTDMPITMDGKSLLWKNLNLVPEDLNLLVISGVKTATGMMRGEEIQAIGLEDELKQFDSGTLILPGTHCKHMYYEVGTFTGLRNYMTGELFEVLSSKSILSNSIENLGWNTDSEQAFLKGIEVGFEGEWSANLLTVRATHLFGESKKEDNFYYLSGLLIGDELSYLKGHTGKVFLAASGAVYKLYKLALEKLIVADNLVCFDSNTLERALLIGQKKIIVLNEK